MYISITCTCRFASLYALFIRYFVKQKLTTVANHLKPSRCKQRSGVVHILPAYPTLSSHVLNRYDKKKSCRLCDQFYTTLRIVSKSTFSKEKAQTSLLHTHAHIFGSQYRSGTVNSKSFVGKVLLRIKWKFELN